MKNFSTKLFIAERLNSLNNFLSKEILLNIVKLNFSKYSYKNECVLIDLSLIGDVLVALPYYHELLKNSKGKINFKIVSLKTTAIFFKRIGLDVIPIDIKSFRYSPFYRLNLIKRIGKVEYSIITHPNRTKDMEELCLNIISKKKIAYEGEAIFEYFWKKTNNNFSKFSHIISNPYKDKKIIHISKHLNKLFYSIAEILNLENKNFDLKKSDYCFIFKKHFSNTLNREKYIVILTDASFTYRRYSRDKWKEILKNLPKNIKIFQIGLNKFPIDNPNIIDLTGKTSLEEAMSIITNASLVIGNETGLTHFSYFSGVPTVCILGGGHFGRFLPWEEFSDVVRCAYKTMNCFQCGWSCEYVDLNKGEIPPCILDIPPENVLEAIEELDYIHKIF